ncbi:MAG: hypothetical protein V4757_07295 [Pseudomonadota bacterium]
MKSRFKPGDMAVTCGAPQQNGLIVEVKAFADWHSDWGVVVFVKSLGSPFEWEPGIFLQEVGWPERLLRPIGNPGDDARDETLDWLPSPAQLDALA